MRKLRERAGLSRFALAVKVGVTERTIIRWENGEQSPTMTIAERIADVLGVSMDDLVGRPRPEDGQAA